MSLYDGEAPETDSEDEIIVPSYLRVSNIQCYVKANQKKNDIQIGDPIPSVKTTAQNFILKGTVVDGETACDNDTLDLMTTPLAIEATEEYWPSSSSPSNQTTSPLSPIYQEHELEYRKLLNEFIKSTTAKATKQIIETDKLMLGSQVILLYYV